MVDTLPYGSWLSPLTAEWASAASPRYDGAAFVADDVWWGESIPADGGRTAVFRRRAGGEKELLLPAPWNARSRVHEYGGGSWAASPDGVLFFAEKSDGRVWSLAPGHDPEALTPDEDAWYGGLSYQGGVLLAVRETPSSRSIVSIATDGEARVTEIVSDSDFVAQPQLSPDGTRLAWIAWDHPNMPWDHTELRVGVLTDGVVGAWTVLAGGTSAALQPTWLSDDDIAFIDDPDGRWNLYRRRPDGTESARPISPADADTGGGLWVLGLSWYRVLADGRIVAVRTDGVDTLVLIDTDGSSRELSVPPRARLNVDAARGTEVLIAGATDGGSGVWRVDVDTGHISTIAGGGDIDAAWIPQARSITTDGPHGLVHAFAFPPTNPTVSAPRDERPPYIVTVHGGPTGNAAGVADAETVFFTSRGIGVLDVNYGGSTGYGRAYRERLRGQWGVVDSDDVAAAAEALAQGGAADPQRLAIEGGSAGGWTVLSALVRTDTFAAGVSRYGVGDARTLATDTHEFESRYLDGLIGPLPEAEEVYIERSPLSHADRFRVPLLLLQGEDDAVVPPSQAEAIRDALAARGIPHAYLLFPEEGHGFRRKETIIAALEAQLAFLGEVLGFTTPGVPDLELEGR